MVATTVVFDVGTVLLARQNFMNSLVLRLIGHARTALSNALDHAITHYTIGSFDT